MNFSRYKSCATIGHTNCILAQAWESDTIQALSERFPWTHIDDQRLNASGKVQYSEHYALMNQIRATLVWIRRSVLIVLRNAPAYAQEDWDSEILWRTFMHGRDLVSQEPLQCDFQQHKERLLQMWRLFEAAYRQLGFDPAGQPTYDDAIKYTARWFQFGEIEERYADATPESITRFEELITQAIERMQGGLVFSDFSWGRMLDTRICVTAQGRVGSVHYLSEIGDDIMIFDGCNMPFVTRKSGAHHQLVGSCYVDGMMYGEEINENTEWTDVHLV